MKYEFQNHNADFTIGLRPDFYIQILKVLKLSIRNVVLYMSKILFSTSSFVLLCKNIAIFGYYLGKNILTMNNMK